MPTQTFHFNPGEVADIMRNHVGWMLGGALIVSGYEVKFNVTAGPSAQSSLAGVPDHHPSPDLTSVDVTTVPQPTRD